MAAPKKKPTPKAEELSKDEETTTTVIPPKPKGKNYVAVHSIMYHPFIKIHIPTGSPGVRLEEVDSWLDSQIKAGLVKEV